MARIFLSHSSLDAQAAGDMRDWLLGEGFEAPFLDFDKHTGIPPGANWERQLYHEIDRSQAILLLLTPHWYASKWCFAEFTQARALGKPVLPVLVSALADGGELPAQDLQALSLVQDRDGGLERLRARLVEITLGAQGGLAWDSRRAPYPGLPALQEEDAAVFFGRDQEIRQVIEHLTACRSLGKSGLLVILGASGAGKSSLLRAGVLPRLRRSGGEWIVPPAFRPERRPLEALALAVDQALGGERGWQGLGLELREALAAGRQRALMERLCNDLRARAGANEATVLLTIDQAEELFTQCEPEERALFVHLLCGSLAAGLPIQAVMTLRSDALALLQAEGGLTVSFEQLSLGPLPMERFAEVITGPARVAGLAVEPALVQRVLRDVGNADALPLLAFTLRELYDRSAPDHQLSTSAYEALGDPQERLTPLDNAVRLAADRALAALRPNQLQLQALHDAFVPGLVRINDRGDYSHQPQAWSQVSPAAVPLLKALVAARVLTLREERGELMVEVAHEALLRKWPLLVGWLDEDRQFLMDCRTFADTQREWQDAPSEARDGLLLSGIRLSRARGWLEDRPQRLNPALRGYVEASISMADRQQRQARLRRTRLLVGLLLLSGLSLLSGAGALIQLHRTRAARANADANAAMALVTRGNNPSQAAISALAALAQQRGPNHLLTDVLSHALAENSAVAGMTLGKGPLPAVLQLGGGDLIGVVHAGRAFRWRTGQGGVEELDAGQKPIAGLAPLGQDSWLSVGRDGSLRRWVGSMPLGPAVAGGQAGVVSLAAFSSGGLAVSGALDGSLRWWRDGLPIGALQRTGHGAIWALLPLADGTVVVGSNRGLLQRWAPSGPVAAAVDSGQGSVFALAALAGGGWASGGADGSVRVWRDGQPIERIGPRQSGAIRAITTFGDGRLAWSSDAGTLVLWHWEQPDRSRVLTLESTLQSLASSGGSTFVSGGSDGTIGLWRWPRAPYWLRDTEQGSVHALLVTRQGLLLTGGGDGTVRQWAGLEPAAPPINTGHSPVAGLQQLANGQLLVESLDGGLSIWDNRAPAGRVIPIPTARLEVPSLLVGVPSLLALRNGDLLAGGYDGKLRRWRGLQQVGPFLTNGEIPVLSLAELQNGEILSGDAEGRLRLLRWPYWQGEVRMAGQGVLLAILPDDARHWWTLGRDGTMRRWRDGEPQGMPVPVVQPNSDWRMARLPNGDLVSTNGRSSFIRRLVPLQEEVAEACHQLRELPELRAPQTEEQRTAAQLCGRGLQRRSIHNSNSTRVPPASP
ncbi:MAG: TIR domain-containing protein [Cyanobium sp.]